MRTTQKQVYQQIESLERQLNIEGYLHLSPQYGYYTLQMYTLDNEGNKSTGTITIASGMSLGQLSQSLSIAIELNYQAKRLKEEIAIAEVKKYNDNVRMHLE